MNNNQSTPDNRISNEEKEKILKDSQILIDSLEKENENIQNESTSKESFKTSYDIDSERKKTKKNKKDKEISRNLGYQRRYLNSSIKISNVILLSIFIILGILVVFKFMAPGMLPEAIMR